MPFFGRANFPCPAPNLCFTGDHFVGKLSAMGRPTQPSIPLDPSMYLHGLQRLRHLKTAEWLQAKVRDHGLGLYAGSVCDQSAAQATVMALYKCTSPLPSFYSGSRRGRVEFTGIVIHSSIFSNN